MSASFTLNWDNTAISGSGNVIGQTASYRKKRTGGAFITAGFTPANDMAKTVNSATTPSTLDYNSIYELKVTTNCTINGPSINSNGIIEQIVFFCLVPVLTNTDVMSTIVLDITGLDVTRARFTLKKTSDNSVIYGPIIVNPVGLSISANKAALIASTSYYWQVELYTVINGVEVISSGSTYLNALCSTTFSTLATVACPAPDTLTVVNGGIS